MKGTKSKTTTVNGSSQSWASCSLTLEKHITAILPSILLYCYLILFIPYQLPASSPSLTHSPPTNPLFPSFSTVLPSLSIPQVHHTEPHCVSVLGREHAVQPLTMCCHWTHLRGPQSTAQPLHTHTPTNTHLSSFLSPCFLPHITLLHHPCFHSTFCSPFFRSHFHCFWKLPTINISPYFNWKKCVHR